MVLEGSTPGGHPSPQAVLDNARKLFDAIGTQGPYDHTVQQRGLEALEADIAAVMTDICHLIASASDPQLRTDVIRQLVRLLSIEHMNGNAIDEKAFSAGVVPVLVEQLRFSLTKGPAEEVEGLVAALALGMLGARHATAFVDAGAIPPLVQLVSSPNDYVRLGAVGALKKVTEGSVARRDAVLAAGILQPLLVTIRESTMTDVVAMGVQLVATLWSVQPRPPLADLAPFVPELVRLFSAPQQDECVKVKARGALAYVGVLCIEAYGTDADRDALVGCGAVASIKTLLEAADPRMKDIACLTATAAVDGGLVPLLVHAAASEEAHVRYNETAAMAIANVLAQGSQQQVEYVVECGGIQPLCDLIDVDNNRNLFIGVMLLKIILSSGREKQANEGLPDNPYCMLVEQAGGVDKIATLQAHTNMDVAAQAIIIFVGCFPARVDVRRVEALVDVGVIQVVRQPGGGEDDRATRTSFYCAAVRQ
ncbi:unnamed protein product [Vitrella brassicaformis CCMP3155]|uniref:Importin subunit alpha n=1 Tax=Vitrella brassicaformis (strain CCMP3155) TaxID=1169540 RepID=A0A0G4FLA7_VITBC|nr:unnamed protein product [Vitrella brassicaformis CCMP3155]|eukprot:CEM14169.1 unnamed protein product [Vitrella brassicaformis CCMP3155]